MEKLMATIVDCSTGEVISRELTNAELEVHERDKLENAAAKAKKIADAEAKAALLKKLGITADEAALLLA